MTKELKKHSGIVVFTAIALLLSVFAFFALNRGLGWFSENRGASGGGMELSIQSASDLVESVEYFSISTVEINSNAPADALDKNIYCFSKNSQSTFTLGTFSLIQPARQALMKLNLKDGAGAVKLGAKSQTTEIGELISGIDAANNLSLILQFSVISAEDADDSDTSLIKISGTNCVHKKFVTLDEDNNLEYTPNGEITPTDAEAIEITSEKPYLYILLDYNENVTQYIKDTNLEKFKDENNSVVDMGFMSIDFYFTLEKIR